MLRYKIAFHYPDLTAPPRWDVSDPLLFIPRNFAAAVKRDTGPWLANLPAGHAGEEAKHAIQMASDEYFSRMGWMGRNQPLELPSGRILVPLYSDGYDFSLLAITDDGGKTWTSSEPIVSMGGVQPSLVRKRDGTIVAYMRNNGPPPRRVIRAESKDDGITWSTPTYTDIPNPGSSMEVTGLRDGLWVLICNDTERDRHSLLVAISDDEGNTWKWRRHLELDTSDNRTRLFPLPNPDSGARRQLARNLQLHPGRPETGRAFAVHQACPFQCRMGKAGRVDLFRSFSDATSAFLPTRVSEAGSVRRPRDGLFRWRSAFFSPCKQRPSETCITPRRRIT